MTLNFGNLIVFSAGNILLFLMGSYPVRGSGSVFPSPPRSRRSRPEILDVSNLWRAGTEEKVEDEVLGAPCMA